MLRPETAEKCCRMVLMVEVVVLLVLANSRMSSAKIRYSMAKIKRYGEIGSPCLMPLLGLKDCFTPLWGDFTLSENIKDFLYYFGAYGVPILVVENCMEAVFSRSLSGMKGEDVYEEIFYYGCYFRGIPCDVTICVFNRAFWIPKRRAEIFLFALLRFSKFLLLQGIRASIKRGKNEGERAYLNYAVDFLKGGAYDAN
ncbi:uncharacterized protein G2W53_037322 [Senna tora]|uniref:Uncharacterized protein n=1 Tax=Senna tora TaxID=362788 RepID=A0A834SV52_9FABA|nr:uncharacterized protein G2W53_037322 [Senna tora]